MGGVRLLSFEAFQRSHMVRVEGRKAAAAAEWAVQGKRRRGAGARWGERTRGGGGRGGGEGDRQEPLTLNSKPYPGGGGRGGGGAGRKLSEGC